MNGITVVDTITNVSQASGFSWVTVLALLAFSIAVSYESITLFYDKKYLESLLTAAVVAVSILVGVQSSVQKNEITETLPDYILEKYNNVISVAQKDYR